MNIFYSLLMISLIFCATLFVLIGTKPLLLEARSEIIEHIIFKRGLCETKSQYFRIVTLRSKDTLLISLLFPVLFFFISAAVVFCLNYINIAVGIVIISFSDMMLILLGTVLYITFVLIIFFTSLYKKLDQDAQYISGNLISNQQ